MSKMKSSTHALCRFRPSRSLVGWSIPAALLIVACALQLAKSQDVMRYDRSLIASGEWWRLLTGNLVHLGWHHFFLDGAGVVLLWLLFGAVYRQWQWGVIVVASMLGVGAGLYLFDPGLLWYVGLSGMLHGIYAAGVVGMTRRERRFSLLLALLLAGKLAWEQWHGAAAATVALIGGAVIVDAHLYGALAGLLAGLLLSFWDKSSPGRRHG